ncbi:MAG: hypothetical protein ACJAUV_001281 [Flavobacteriales bacterium]|jgi:hypothetical protein
MFTEKEFENWGELKSFLSSLNSNWVYRGQSDYSWKLESSIDRTYLEVDMDNKKQLFEKFCIHDFKRNPHLYSNKYSIHSDFQTLSLLQHYGSPTRLLDFSRSQYVAAYFATVNSNEDSSIYAINYFELLSSTMHLFRLNYDDESFEIVKLRNGGSISEDDSFKNIVLNTNQRKFVELVQPYFKFDRMIKQSGLFLCQGDINVDFETNLNANYQILQNIEGNNPYFKLKINKEWKKEIIRDLERMNISSSSLFPGIEGHLQSQKNKFQISIEDRGDSIIQ